MPAPFQTGLDVLLTRHRAWLKGKRVGLLAHPASVDARGAHAANRLHSALGKNLAALFGPEHGFFGDAGAGEKVSHSRHPAWNIPIHSLYADQRRPTAAMLHDLDVLIFDLQDLAVRCYTFVSTLRYVMEACAAFGKTLIICDRPIPFPNIVDGPMLDPEFESFVACVNMPLVYGMTPGEAALFLHSDLKLKLDLRISKMTGWKRAPARPRFPWIPPSPGIRSWEIAWCYPATVWAEALTAVDIGRGGSLPFQLVMAPWLDAEKLAYGLKFEGARAVPHWGRHPGIRLVVTEPDTFHPVSAGLKIIHALGPRAWMGARVEWFNKLMGTDRALKTRQFQNASFVRARKRCLLYS